MRDISRRDFLKGSVAAAAALGLTGIAPAFAEEAKTEEKEKLVPSTTVDCDAVVVGAGAAGLMAAMELAAGEGAPSLRDGLIAHSLGTDLGTGWLLPDGSVPPLPLEFYDLILDLGSRPARALPPEDLRAVRNPNSGLPGARR